MRIKLAILCLLSAFLLGCTADNQAFPQKPDAALRQEINPHASQSLPTESSLPESSLVEHGQFSASNPEIEEIESGEETKELEEIPPDNSVVAPKTMMYEKEVTDEMAAFSFANPEELNKLDNETIVWGPGVAKDGQVPFTPISLQKEYGELGAYFYVPNSKEIYLSFDEGYELGYTPIILDILKEKNAKAVFFVTMGYVKSRPDLVQRMIDEGHVVGNHSTKHPVGGMPTMEIYEIAKDILKLHNYVSENFGYKMTMFRPPEGTFSQRSLAALHELGYSSVLWSFAYNDWNPENQKPLDEALNHMVSCLHPGGIYLLHAVSSTNTSVLGAFIDEARGKGYEFSDWQNLEGEETPS